MKRYIAPLAIAAIGASMFIIGATQAAPAPDEPPVVPIADTVPDQEWVGPDEAVVTEGYGYRVYSEDAFPTTPQHDQCWRNDGGEILESGTFVLFEDGRTWGTHSIGAMRCGPADTPQAPAPVDQEPVVPVVPVVEATASATECITP